MADSLTPAGDKAVFGPEAGVSALSASTEAGFVIWSDAQLVACSEVGFVACSEAGLPVLGVYSYGCSGSEVGSLHSLTM